MKLRELNLMQESFVPIETMMAIDGLRKGECDNINHKFILAQVVNYIKDHPVTAERFRDINEFRPSVEVIDAIKAMSAKDLSELAEWAHCCIQKAMNSIEQDSYTDPSQDVNDFIRAAIKGSS